jgi:hypothetical protein
LQVAGGNNKLLLGFNTLIRTTSILLLAYYLFGTLFLPDGDFAVIVDLPQMYVNCKATEDKDMTAFDFITDHLIDIDGIFNQQEDGGDKPHTPVQFHHSGKPVNFVNQPQQIAVVKPVPPVLHNALYIQSNICYGYVSGVFRPPVV